MCRSHIYHPKPGIIKQSVFTVAQKWSNMLSLGMNGWMLISVSLNLENTKPIIKHCLYGGWMSSVRPNRVTSPGRGLAQVKGSRCLGRFRQSTRPVLKHWPKSLTHVRVGGWATKLSLTESGTMCRSMNASFPRCYPYPNPRQQQLKMIECNETHHEQS